MCLFCQALAVAAIGLPCHLSSCCAADAALLCAGCTYRTVFVQMLQDSWNPSLARLLQLWQSEFMARFPQLLAQLPLDGRPVGGTAAAAFAAQPAVAAQASQSRGSGDGTTSSGKSPSAASDAGTERDGRSVYSRRSE